VEVTNVDEPRWAQQFNNCFVSGTIGYLSKGGAPVFNDLIVDMMIDDFAKTYEYLANSAYTSNILKSFRNKSSSNRSIIVGAQYVPS